MTSYVGDLRDYAQNYWNGIPQNAGKQVLVSFAGAFVVRSLIRNNPTLGLMAGAASATAALIHALITPFFKSYAEGRESLTTHEEMCRGGIALIGTGCLAAALGNFTIIDDLFGNAMVYFLRLNFGSVSVSTDESNWMFVYPLYTK